MITTLSAAYATMSAQALPLANAVVDQPEPVREVIGQFGSISGAINSEHRQVCLDGLPTKLGVPQLVASQAVGKRSGVVAVAPVGAGSGRVGIADAEYAAPELGRGQQKHRLFAPGQQRREVTRCHAEIVHQDNTASGNGEQILNEEPDRLAVQAGHPVEPVLRSELASLFAREPQGRAPVRVSIGRAPGDPVMLGPVTVIDSHVKPLGQDPGNRALPRTRATDQPPDMRKPTSKIRSGRTNVKHLHGQQCRGPCDQKTVLFLHPALENMEIETQFATGRRARATRKLLSNMPNRTQNPPIHKRRTPSVSPQQIRPRSTTPALRVGDMSTTNRSSSTGDFHDQLQRTSEYKIKPLKAAARALLGYPHPTRVPPGIFAEQAIGISVDEFHRAKDSDVRYLRNVFPLLDMGMSRDDCITFLQERDFGETVKSACIGCPYSGNARLRQIRDTEPDAWADLVEFDRAIRNGSPRAIAEGKPLRGQFFIHRSLKPLDQVDLGQPIRGHLRMVGGSAVEDDDPDGCSPWSCRSGEPVDSSIVEQAA
jgi:hypothetical protein